MIHVVSEGQDILDVCIQKFGDLDSLFDLLADNPDLSLDSAISSAQQLTINNENKGTLDVKTAYENVNFVVMNASVEDLATAVGDFNDDFNDDFLNT